MPAPIPFRIWPILHPLSWLYGRVMQMRNRRFDTGRLPIGKAAVKVVSVGNLSVGGTGKTPMCIWLLRLMMESGAHPALLSRGYGRRTRGFLHVDGGSTTQQVGDEPLEIHRIFDGIVPVFVCEDRVEGARRITKVNSEIDCIILDDAYQHRYIHRDIDILLTDYNRLYTRDRVLPEGRLREKAEGAARADIIIVTKCPAGITQEEAEAVKRELQLRTGQRVFFSAIDYEPLSLPKLEQKSVLLFTGIANPQPLTDYFAPRCLELQAMIFPDHHSFSAKDISHIDAAAKGADVVISTAKDFSRLPESLPPALKEKLCVQHIGVKILFNQEQELRQLIIRTFDHE